MALDLKLLPHLSERALREEADRRGIVADGLDRDALIEAIRAHEARLLTIPPAPPELSGDATAPPARAEDRGPLEAARSLIGRVVGLARSALERRSEPPPEDSEPEQTEPIRTRSLARLLEDQGHLERALAMVRQLAAEEPDDEELARWARHLERRVAETELRAALQSALASPSARVELRRASSLRGVAWRVDESGVARARALLGTPGALTLRVVRVLAHPDHSVETRQEDRRPLEASGWALLDAPERARLVVAVGLADGDRFVSIAHAAG